MGYTSLRHSGGRPQGKALRDTAGIEGQALGDIPLGTAPGAEGQGPGGRLAFVPGAARGGGRRGGGAAGSRSMCSCGRHLAGSRSAGDVRQQQAGRKALDSSDKSSPARRSEGGGRRGAGAR